MCLCAHACTCVCTYTSICLLVGVLFFPRVLLFIDEADAFLRKRSTVSDLCSLYKYDLPHMLGGDQSRF